VICATRTLSRIQDKGGNLHRRHLKLLLQRVNTAGQRFDYEVITDRYEDYLLRSELDRALIAGMTERAKCLLGDLQNRIPDYTTNRQYIMKTIQLQESINHPPSVLLLPLVYSCARKTIRIRTELRRKTFERRTKGES